MSSCPQIDLIDTPWTTYHELEQVYRLIYQSEDTVDNLRQALGHLLSWSTCGTRRLHKLEIAAVTAFVNAALFEKTNPCEEVILRSLYSSAIIDFCEVLRKYQFSLEKNRIVRLKMFRTGENRSEVAESLGLPGWIVDLRHNAAHGDQVCLKLMKKAAAIAMNWLSDNFWLRVQNENRFDRITDLIVSHVFSDEQVVDGDVKQEFRRLMHRSAYSTVRFTVKSLISYTAGSDLTLFQMNHKLSALIEIVVQQGQIHLLLNNLIDYFDDEDSNIKSAATVIFGQLLYAMTSDQSSQSSPSPLSRFSDEKSIRNPLITIHFMRIVNRLMIFPSETTHSLLGYFPKIIPEKKQEIEQLCKVMSTFLGIGLTGSQVPMDYESKTLTDVMHFVQTGAVTGDEKRGVKRKERSI